MFSVTLILNEKIFQFLFRFLFYQCIYIYPVHVCVNVNYVVYLFSPYLYQQKLDCEKERESLAREKSKVKHFYISELNKKIKKD